MFNLFKVLTVATYCYQTVLLGRMNWFVAEDTEGPDLPWGCGCTAMGAVAMGAVVSCRCALVRRSLNS